MFWSEDTNMINTQSQMLKVDSIFLMDTDGLCHFSAIISCSKG